MYFPAYLYVVRTSKSHREGHNGLQGSLSKGGRRYMWIAWRDNNGDDNHVLSLYEVYNLGKTLLASCYESWHNWCNPIVPQQREIGMEDSWNLTNDSIVSLYEITQSPDPSSHKKVRSLSDGRKGLTLTQYISDIRPEAGQAKIGLLSDMAIYPIIFTHKLTNGT